MKVFNKEVKVRKFTSKIIVVIIMTFITTLFTNACIYATPGSEMVDKVLDKVVNKIELTIAIDIQYVDATRDVMLLSKEGYTVESWDSYFKALDDVIKVEKNDKAKQNEVDDATIRLRAKKSELKSDLTAYNAALAKVTQGAYTIISWTNYQLVVTANVVTDTNTPAQVARATKSITDAQLNLVLKADLTAYNAAVAAVPDKIKKNYAKKIWETYQAVVAANIVTVEDTQVAVDVATAKIVEAQKNLVADLSEYNEVLAQVVESNCTPKSWADYQKIVTANIMTLKSPQPLVELTILKLKVVQFFLKVDLTAYNTLLDAVTSEGYTKSSWDAYKAVVSKNVVTDRYTAVEVTKATKNITEAQAKLEADLTAYNEVINAVNEKNYSIATWATYQAVVNANIVTVKNTPAQVLVAKDAIKAAQNSLVFAGQTDFDAALLIANSKSQLDYTIISWAALTSARALPHTTNDLMVTKTSAINNAINGLVFAGKANLDIAKALAATKVQSTYTSSSWLALTNALALSETTNALMVEKTIAINNAIAGLSFASIKYKVTSYTGLNCRVSPTVYSNRVRVYSFGTVLEITETSNGWGKTAYGWVSMTYVTKVAATTPVLGRYQVTPYMGLNCRVAATINSNKVTAYSYKIVLEISEILNGWGKIQRGWVCMQYLNKI